MSIPVKRQTTDDDSTAFTDVLLSVRTEKPCHKDVCAVADAYEKAREESDHY